MKKKSLIACVTGASGVVGCRIVEKLLQGGWHVRALSRRKGLEIDKVEMFYGGLDDKEVLRTFVSEADQMYHCAAELYNETEMDRVNVQGTKNLIDALEKSSIQLFVYLSSAGVVGLSSEKWIDESINCNPISAYEKSKFKAEKYIIKSSMKFKSIILRPTNVVDEKKIELAKLPLDRSFRDRIRILLKGGEKAHIVHAEDVARASVFLSNYVDQNAKPQIYFVSNDHDPNNTYSMFWSILNTKMKNKSLKKVTKATHLPIIFPYLVRKLMKGPCNKGDVSYSSKKLLSTGFRYNYNIEMISIKIASRLKGNSCLKY